MDEHMDTPDGMRWALNERDGWMDLVCDGDPDDLIGAYINDKQGEWRVLFPSKVGNQIGRMFVKDFTEQQVRDYIILDYLFLTEKPT